MISKTSNLSSPDDPRPFSCESCGRQFSTSAYLSQHRRIHSRIKPYACRFCDRKFTQLSHVQQHERIHTGEKPYSCFTCLKSFTQMSNLYSHQRQHMKNKPCKCSNCFMAFDSQQELESHIESKHSSVKYNKVLICPVCAKMYNSETYLKKHIERHEESSCKSIDCSQKNSSICDPVIKYSRSSKLLPSGEITSTHPSTATLNNSSPNLIDHSVPNHQMLSPSSLHMKDSQFSENMSMALNISKSIVTAASGLRLNVILESLASTNCPSPLVSAAASVWGHSLLPNPNNRMLGSNINIENNPTCFDLSSIGRHSKSSHQSIMNQINRPHSNQNSIHLLTNPHLTDLVNNSLESHPLDIASPHINIPTTAFSLR